jgi:type VI secretion system secreted protein Hcp
VNFVWRLFLGTITGFACASLSGAIYIKIDGVEGESQDANHDKWIDVLSISGGLFNSGTTHTGGGTGTGVANFQDLYLTKYVDKASPLLVGAASSGQIYRDAFIEVTKAGTEAQILYFEYRLTNILVTSVSTGGSGGEDRLTENVSLNYAKVNWHYYQVGPDGQAMGEVSANWDIVANKGGLGDGGGGTTNTPPTIEPLLDVPTLPATPIDVLIVINDAQTPASELQVTASTNRPDLIPEISLSGTGAERTLSLRTSALYSGTAGVTIRVSDGEFTSSTSFAVLIDVEMTPFEAYMMANFTAEELADPQIASPIGDPDKDDIPTIVEFMLITNPNAFTPPHHAITVSRQDSDSEGRVKVQFRRRTDQPVITGRVYHSVDYETWNELVQGGSAPPYSEETTSGDTFWEWVTGTLIVPPGSPDTNAFRIQVETE